MLSLSSFPRDSRTGWERGGWEEGLLLKDENEWEWLKNDVEGEKGNNVMGW